MQSNIQDLEPDLIKLSICEYINSMIDEKCSEKTELHQKKIVRRSALALVVVTFTYEEREE